jgi:hypothetical protein
VAVVLFLALRDRDEGPTAATEPTSQSATATETGTGPTTSTSPQPDPAPERRRIRLTIPADGPEGIQRIEVEQDERVVLLIRSGVADHAHLHGYDLMTDVGPGTVARIRFRADIPGRFELELEDRRQQFAELTVAP